MIENKHHLLIYQIIFKVKCYIYKYQYCEIIKNCPLYVIVRIFKTKVNVTVSWYILYLKVVHVNFLFFKRLINMFIFWI